MCGVICVVGVFLNSVNYVIYDFLNELCVGFCVWNARVHHVHFGACADRNSVHDSYSY